MTDQVHINLLYSPSAERAEHFFEVRRCGQQVWTAEGAVHTFGEDNLIECRDAQDAENVAARLVEQKSSEGFTLTRSLVCAADDFDYDDFIAEVVRGMEAFWRNLMTSNPSLPVDRLAIATDGGVMALSGHAHVSAPMTTKRPSISRSSGPTAKRMNSKSLTVCSLRSIATFRSKHIHRSITKTYWNV